MSLESETTPEASPATAPAKPPFYRQPLVLVLTGAIIIILILAVVLTAVLVHRSDTTVPEALPAATDSSVPTVTPRSTPSATATATPSPSATATAPQAAPPQAAPAPPAAAPAPPVAAAPAPPTSTGPGRTAPTSTVTASIYDTRPPNFVCASPSASIPITLHWTSTGGTKWTLGDTALLINNGNTDAVAASGSRSVSQPCSLASDDYYFIATKIGTPGTSKRADDTVKPTF